MINSEPTIDGVPISTIDTVIQQIAQEREMDFRRISIREVNLIGIELGKRLGIQVVGMDMGIPGLETPPGMLDAIRNATEGNCCAQYTSFEGIPELKEATAYFLEQFLGLRVNPKNAIPTVGGMHGCKEVIGIIGRRSSEQDTVINLVPGFSVNKLQAQIYGVKTHDLDYHELYGDNLITAIEKIMQQGNIAAILWSSPNNPTWRVLSERELEGIGKLCTKHNAFALEDAAYFGLDSRMKERRIPGQAPYFPTVANYTNNWIMLLSASKIFNFAGERGGVVVFPEEVANLEGEGLRQYYGRRRFWDALVQGGLYATVASVSFLTQKGFAAGLHAAADPKDPFDVFTYDKPYEERSHAGRIILAQNGFGMPYARDDYGEMGYGYYSTHSHPHFKTGEDLARAMLTYGMTAVPLIGSGGSRREGIRICWSKLTEDKQVLLEQRAKLFNERYL